MITRQEAFFERVNISELLEEMTQLVNQDLHIRMDIQQEVWVTGDRGLIRIAMENLIGNAIKYSSHEENPHIIFDTVSENGVEYLRVTDNGVGFDMHYASKLFTPFQRLHTDAEFKGNGIGLALVQRIINKHGGDIHAKSAPGEGASFLFRFSGTKKINL
jgi:signal transduction histidine kinase